MLSINQRLSFSSSVVLLFFLGLTAFILDSAYQHSAKIAVEDELKGHLYALLAAGDIDINNHFSLEILMQEDRWTIPNSGLYGQVLSANSHSLWLSPSALELNFTYIMPDNIGEYLFSEIAKLGDEVLFVLSMKVLWELESKEIELVFSVAKSKEYYLHQIDAFRHTLLAGLGGSALIFLVIQWWIVRWGLSPLRRVAAEVLAIESGVQENIKGIYPKELQGLSENLNALIKSEQSRRKRYRNSVGDLAHSLKTPLSILMTMSSQKDAIDKKLLNEQSNRMREIIELQLQRATLVGKTAYVGEVNLAKLIKKIVASLHKVYYEKTVSCHVTIDEMAKFHGDRGDIMECLGNILDNAYKWCRHSVVIKVANVAEADKYFSGVSITIEDDGAGIAEEMISCVVERGLRADTQIHGHGLGLNMVKNVMDAYDGEFEIKQSDLGGAYIALYFPPLR